MRRPHRRARSPARRPHRGRDALGRRLAAHGARQGDAARQQREEGTGARLGVRPAGGRRRLGQHAHRLLQTCLEHGARLCVGARNLARQARQATAAREVGTVRGAEVPSHERVHPCVVRA